MENDTFTADWMQGMTDLQKKMWDDWSNAVQKTMAGGETPFNPMSFFQGMKPPDLNALWGQSANPFAGMGAFPAMGGSFTAPGAGLPNWNNLWGPVLSGFSKPTTETMAMQNLVATMDGFMRMGQEVFKVFQKMGDGMQEGEEWTALLDQSIQQAKALFQESGNTFAAQDPMAAWNQPLTAWKGMLQNNPLFSGPLMNTILQAAGGSSETPLEGVMERMLSIPGLGLTREKQERMQEGVRHGIAYRKAYEAHRDMMNRMNLRALDLFHKKLLERGASDEPINSMRELYVLWVDCSEEANSETVTSDEYQELNAQMVNALVRVQNHVQGMIDDYLEAMNMPTRKEVDSAHRQVHALKRRVRELEATVKALGNNSEHRAEVRAVREEMERLDIRGLREEVANLTKKVAALDVKPAAAAARGKTTEDKPRPRTRTSTATAKKSKAGATDKGA